MKTLHTIHSLDNKLGGAVHAGLNVCRGLVAAGQEVEVMATRGVRDDLAYLQTNYRDVPYEVLPRCFPERWYNGTGLGPWLDRNVGRFDVVELHAVFSFVTMQTAKACRRLGKPYLLRPHGSLDPFDLAKRAGLKRLLGPLFIRPVLAGATGVMCTSQREANLVETYGAKPRRFVVPLPVPHNECKAGGRERFRAKHGIPANAFVVLFLSRIDYKKGLDFLLPALASARKTHNDLWFVLAGGGDPVFGEGVRSKIRELGLPLCTREIGFVSGNEKAEAFRASDLFALPSLNENFGIVIVEAMQAGIPVLISDQVYIHPEIIGAGAGILCRPDASDCERALRAILDNRGEARAMGRRAAQLSEAKFSPAAATRELIELYRRVLTSKQTNP